MNFQYQFSDGSFNERISSYHWLKKISSCFFHNCSSKQAQLLRTASIKFELRALSWKLSDIFIRIGNFSSPVFAQYTIIFLERNREARWPKMTSAKRVFGPKITRPVRRNGGIPPFAILETVKPIASPLVRKWQGRARSSRTWCSLVE